MARRLPARNLNPSAVPWGRELETRLGDLDRSMGKAQQLLRALNKASLRQRGSADASIYRSSGIIAPASDDDFTIFHGASDEDVDTYGSFNVMPGYVVGRSVNNISGDAALPDGFFQLGPYIFEAGWGVSGHDILSHSGGDEIITGDEHALQYRWFDPTKDAGNHDFTLSIGSGFITASHQNDQTVFKIGDWIEGRVDTDLASGTQTRQLIFFGHKMLSNDDGDTVGGGGGSAGNATTEARGIVELATVEEAEAGTDAVRAVTPAGLAAAIGAIPPPAATYNLADAWLGEWVAP